MFDFAIRNALICDGSGEPAFQGEIAVQGDKIAAIDKSVGPASENIDAQGLVVSPGIIDSHTHYDAQITWDSDRQPIVIAWGNNLDHGQLRLHDCPVPATGPRTDAAQPDAGRRYVTRCAPGGYKV